MRGLLVERERETARRVEVLPRPTAGRGRGLGAIRDVTGDGGRGPCWSRTMTTLRPGLVVQR